MITSIIIILLSDFLKTYVIKNYFERSLSHKFKKNSNFVLDTPTFVNETFPAQFDYLFRLLILFN